MSDYGAPFNNPMFPQFAGGRTPPGRAVSSAAGAGIDSLAELFGLPTSMRLYGRALVHDPRPITEDDFYPSELAQLYHDAKAFGGDGWVNRQDTANKLVHVKRPDDELSDLGQLFSRLVSYSSSPAAEVETTLGQYRVQPAGAGYVLSDMYNFNPGSMSRGDALRQLPSAFGESLYSGLRKLGEVVGPRGAWTGRGDDTAQGIPVRIRVSPPPK